jgi:hypothetical protein
MYLNQQIPLHVTWLTHTAHVAVNQCQKVNVNVGNLQPFHKSLHKLNPLHYHNLTLQTNQLRLLEDITITGVIRSTGLQF